MCALLASKYAAILDALCGELGDAAVVRVGPADAEEPYPPHVLGPDELPGPPPARYVIECVLPDGHLLHVSDHRRYGLRKVARPADAPDAWIVEIWSRRGDFTSGLVGTATSDEHSVSGLLVAVRDALHVHGMRAVS
ncbi:hypothetical protein [Mycolicibacterium frederiksbergense]|uniref:hypothetical protein n=1 Tax=Mycolicibacterium frederiksbergense TaxID=117567 RepID=UPI001AE236F6|nr:hypothetical protein [Mycolicibacterium frederiksbergense]